MKQALKCGEGRALPVRATVTHQFGAPPELLFDAWTDPKLILKFIFGPQLRDEEMVSIQTNPWIGGSFSFGIRHIGRQIDYVGQYLEIDRPHRLVFTWAVRQELPECSCIVIVIEPLGAGCVLTLTHEMTADRSYYLYRAKAAWTEILHSLGAII